MSSLPFAIGRASVPAPWEGLPAEERAIAESFGAEERRAEFAAGRAAARRALAAMGVAGPVVIDRHPDSAPRVVGHDDVLLSITHGRRDAVAVAARGLGLLGCDLAELAQAPRVERVARRFMLPEDVALGGAGDWVALWALKEAAAKAQRLGLLTHDGLKGSRLVSIDPPRFVEPAGLEAILERGPDSVLAIVWRR